MKIAVTLDDADHPDLPWPDGVPLPVPGDHVTIQVGDAVVSCVVNSRAFEIGLDGAQIRIQGGRGLAAS